MPNKNELFNKWFFKIDLSDVRTEDYEKNEARAQNPCFFCGKNIKNERYFVHFLTEGALVSVDEFNLAIEEDSQGSFPIGNNCKSKIPSNFYYERF